MFSDGTKRTVVSLHLLIRAPVTLDQGPTIMVHFVLITSSKALSVLEGAAAKQVKSLLGILTPHIRRPGMKSAL